jgi:putative flippase GtrA
LRTTVVIPCWNEAQRLDRTAFASYAASHPDVRLLFVNDGSTDGTLAVLQAIAASAEGRIGVLDQPENRGKAEAVRAGMLAAIDAGAEYVGYFDADLATPLDAIEEFVATLDDRADIDVVLGARVALLGRYIERRPLRHYLGRLFATAASVVLDLAVYDTQCGAKLMRVKPFLRGLFEAPFGSRWIFDVELIARYLSMGGMPSGIYELPLHRWTDVGESKVKSIDFVRAIGEMAAIYRTYQLPRRFRALLGLLTQPFLRYVAAGGFGTALHYLTLIVFVELFAMRAAIATTLGAIVGAVTNYFLNYHFTFASRLRHTYTLPRFLLVAAMSAGISAGGMWVATELAHVHYLLAQVLCTGAVLVFGYVVNKLWTFGARERITLPAQAVAAAPDADARTKLVARTGNEHS